MSVRRCKECKRKLPLEQFEETVPYEPMPGVRKVYRRWVCKGCMREAKQKAYKRMSDRARKERRATQRMAGDDKRREEGKSVRRSKNHLT